MYSLPKNNFALRYITIMLLIATLAIPVTVCAGKKININTATTQELQTLPKIGPKTAAAIIKYRKQHPFQSVDELVKVKGIGKKTLAKLKPLVTVGEKGKKKTAVPKGHKKLK